MEIWRIALDVFGYQSWLFGCSGSLWARWSFKSPVSRGAILWFLFALGFSGAAAFEHVVDSPPAAGVSCEGLGQASEDLGRGGGGGGLGRSPLGSFAVFGWKPLV